MTLRTVEQAARLAEEAIASYENRFGKQAYLVTIRKQMEFIRRKASEGKNPVAELNGERFTYAVVASRELSSPEEKQIKANLNAVSNALDELGGTD